MSGLLSASQLQTRICTSRAPRRHHLNERHELDLQIAAEDMSMTRIPLWLMVIIAIVLSVLGGRAISAQDKFSREHAPGIPEPGDESPPAPSRHAIVPDLPAAAPIPDPQGPPAAEQPAEALAVNTPEPSAPVSKAPDLPAEAATPELHPQVAEKPAEAVNTPEHHLDASPPNYSVRDLVRSGHDEGMSPVGCRVAFDRRPNM